MLSQSVVDSRLVETLESMLLIRQFEEKSAELQASGLAPTMCTAVGQEASAVGVVRALQPHDQILTNHRSRGHLLARGANPALIMAEIMGKSTGYCKGKAGNLHLSVKELGVVLTSTIVGGELSLAPGVGLSVSMSDSDAIVACFFGDGAACEGIFHESLNLASVWELPILYICENNQWQAFVHRRETMQTDHISEWAQSYKMPSQTVDGNDVAAVFEAAQKATEYVRTTRKPFLLETYTYRLRGHMEPDDQSYVDPQELSSWQQKDPVTTFANQLCDRGILSSQELEALHEQVHQTVEEAVAFAIASPYPNVAELTTDVYA